MLMALKKLQFPSCSGLSCPVHTALLPWVSPCLCSLFPCLSHQPALLYQPSSVSNPAFISRLPNLALYF